LPRFTSGPLRGDVLAALDYDVLTGLFTHKRSGLSAGFAAPRGYWYLQIKGRKFLAHRLAWLFVHGAWPGELDHIDGDRRNNKLSNLRECDRSQNCMNRKASSRNLSGFKGVSFNERAKAYRARIHVNGRDKFLGHYSTPEQAHAVYEAAAKRYYGQFARAA